MKPKEYELMQRCVEESVAYGLRRARKYGQDDEAAAEQIVLAVMGEICEWFHFPLPPEN